MDVNNTANIFIRIEEFAVAQTFDVVESEQM